MGTMKMEFYLKPTTLELQIQKTQKMPRNDPRQECYQVHPVTGTDIRLCLFDIFHESNTSSEIESLRKIWCVLELNRMFNSKVEEQPHLKFDSNKKFLYMMTPINHIYLF